MVAAVVLTVSVDDPACVAVTITCAGLKLQVGMYWSPLLFPATEQDRLIAPVNPPPGVTLTGIVRVSPGVTIPDAGVL